MTASRIGVFERPGADFTLRRTLELLCGAAQARTLMERPSRFVVQAGQFYLPCADLTEVFRTLGVLWWRLSKDGVRDIAIDTAVEPSTKAVIDAALVEMEKAVRPAAANDP
jgi:hypothetical protein